MPWYNICSLFTCSGWCVQLVHTNAVFYALIDCQFKQRNVVLPRGFHDFPRIVYRFRTQILGKYVGGSKHALYYYV